MYNPTMPSFFVVGASKCGTTSLYYYLNQHPDIYLPIQKELHFFSSKQLLSRQEGPGDKDSLEHICRSLGEYQKHYSDNKENKVAGDISPSYFYYSDTAKSIKDARADAKIIIMLRNPVEKAYSQYMHLTRENRENKSFYDALLAESDRKNSNWSDMWLYTDSGKYLERTNDFINTFGKDNVLIVTLEEFEKDTFTQVQHILKFIGVNPEHPIDTTRVLNRTGKPRSTLLANAMSRSSVAKGIIKKFVPEKLRQKIRFFLMDINTASKPAIPINALAILEQQYKAETPILEQAIGRTLPWK